MIYSRVILKNTLLFSVPLLIAYAGQIFLQQSPILLHTGNLYELGLINYSNKLAILIAIGVFLNFLGIEFLYWW